MTPTVHSVLDASALLALLLDEPGADRVGTRLDAGAAITTVNLAEVVGYFARIGLEESEIRADIAEIPVEIVPFDETLAYDAGLLLPPTRTAGLSLGDRACLSLARRLGALVVTADRQWQAIAEPIGVRIEQIR